MYSPACRRAFRPSTICTATHSASEFTLPAFLVPAFTQRWQQRANFSATRSTKSKIGKAPLTLPPDVTFNIMQTGPAVTQERGMSRTQPGAVVEIQGPLGKMSYPIPAYMNIQHDEAAQTYTLSVLDKRERKQREMWGTVRAYLQNHIMGVSEGHTAILRLVGVGYRATVENTATTVQSEYEGQKFVNLKVGFSHPVELGIPKGVKASTPQPTRLLLEGAEKEVVMQFAAEIKAWRRPEPYKGKGIFVNGETIKLKAKKIK